MQSRVLKPTSAEPYWSSYWPTISLVWYGDPYQNKEREKGREKREEGRGQGREGEEGRGERKEKREVYQRSIMASTRARDPQQSIDIEEEGVKALRLPQSKLPQSASTEIAKPCPKFGPLSQRKPLNPSESRAARIDLR